MVIGIRESVHHSARDRCVSGANADNFFSELGFVRPIFLVPSACRVRPLCCH